MRTFRNNPHPVDMKDFYQGHLTVVGGRDFDEEERDEEFTDKPEPVPTFTTNLRKIRKSVSEKLFSIEFGKISF